MSLFTGPMHFHLNGHKDLTIDKEIVTKMDPDVIYVPMANGNTQCTPIVQVGDEVKVGTKLAENEKPFYFALYSPVSGTVTEVKKFMSSNMTQVQHLMIQNDHKHTDEKPFEPLDYTKASREELLEFVKKAGILGLGGAGFPCYAKYTNPKGAELLIINGVECEPYLTTDYNSINMNMDLLKTGVLALLKLSTAPKAVVAIKEDKPKQIAALKECFEGTSVEVQAVPNVYPMGWERTVVYQVTGKRYDRLPLEAGCIVNNAQTAIAVGNALVNGMPITHKLVTVSGEALADPQNVYVPVGTKAHDIIDAIGGYKDGVEDVRIIAGGPMMGKAIPNDQFVISVKDDALTVLENDTREAIACLRCGRCTESCPAGLEPVRISNEHKAVDYDQLMKLHVLDCIQCGLCSYVCPSHIDVSENVRRAQVFTRGRMPKGGK